MALDKGDRVHTVYGMGTILYKRMAAPDYVEVATYCVCLDSKKEESEKPPFPFYNGTMFNSGEIK